MEKLFTALADRTRLRLLNLLSHGEICVCYFTMILDAPQPTISRHLAYLRRSGLVATRREGKWIHYRIQVPADASAARVFRVVLEEAARDRQMQRDSLALSRACCALKLPAEVSDAPRPTLVRALG